MAKKTETAVPTDVPPSPITYKTVKLSIAETLAIQALNTQKNDLDKKIMETVASILETRDVNQAEIVGGLSLADDTKSLSFSIRVAKAAKAPTIDEGTF